MQMTARGERTKLVTTLSRHKKDSSQQSKRGSGTLRTQAGTAPGFAIIPGSPIESPNSCLFCDRMLTGATLDQSSDGHTRVPPTPFKTGMEKESVTTRKVQGQFTSTLLGEAWHRLPTTTNLPSDQSQSNLERHSSYSLHSQTIYTVRVFSLV